MGRSAFLWMVLFFTSSTFARAMEEDFGAWTGVFAQGKLSENWGWSLENQVRLHSGWEFAAAQPESIEVRANRLLIRPALRWLPRGDSTLQFHLGYGWTPNFSPVRGEHRVWEQVQFQGGQAEDGWAWLQRLRLEQRHIELTRGLHHRARYMAKAQRYFGTSNALGASIWDEIFWNLNTLERGPRSGLDQNRVFAGPVVQVSGQARIEWGYLNVYYAKGSARTAWMSHVLATYLYFEL